MSYDGLLDNDENLMDLISEDFPYYNSHEWQSDGGLELFNTSNQPIIRLSKEEVNIYVNRIIEDSSFDNVEMNDGHIIDEDYND